MSANWKIGFTLTSAFASAALIAAAAPQSTSADSAEQSPTIQWRTASDDPAGGPNVAGASAVERIAELAKLPDRHIVVQFDQPVTDEMRADLGSAGVTLLRYLGQNAFFAALDPQGVDLPALDNIHSLIAASSIRMPFKVHPQFANGAAPQHAIVGSDDQAGTIVAAYVVFHPDVPLDPDAANLMQEYNVTIRDSVSLVNALVIELPLASLLPLAAEDRVQWIEPPLPRMSEWNDSNRSRTGADTAQAAPYSLNGSGVTVLVYDAGTARATHQDFGGRLTVRDASGLLGHSTHVAGTIGGSGAASGGTWRGMAPGVTIQSYGFQYDGTGIFLYTNPGDLQSDYNQAINTFGADIANNSIGTNTETNGFPCDIQGDYGVTDQLIDNIVRGSLGTPMRIVWANGNERQGTRCNVEGFGSYYSTAPPATAKNHITVGALNSNDDSMTSFSSWGPTDDGRMKPDISSAGCQSNGDFGVTSCYSGSDTQYAALCGTSMAAPTVCGLSALLMQDYRARFPGPDMRNSTLKILLAQTAVDLGNVGPDYQFGYGSVRIVPAVDFMRTGNFRESAVSGGGVVSYTVTVAAGTPQLKVMLAWDDFAGTPNVIPSLINDLDLRVFSPSSTQSFPWTLNPSSPSSAAVRTARNTRDNIEQVLVDNPAAGTWTVEVFGFNVPQGPQPFSICASPNLNDGGPCTAPGAPTGVAASDGTSCSSITVSWNASSGATSYSIWRNTVNNSGTATQIGTDSASPFDDTTASLGQTYFYWVKAANACGESGFSATDSGSLGNLVPAAPTGVAASDGTSCTSVTVSWNAVSGATQYEVWRNTVDDSATATSLGVDSASPFSDSSVTPGTTYFYWVTANNACGNSAFSASDSGFAQANTIAAPTGVTATDGTLCNSVSVSWNAVGGASSYTIWRNTVNNSGSATQIGTASASPFSDTTALASTTYFYWVQAVGPCGSSSFGGPDTGSRGSGTAPAAPSNLTATDGQCNATTLTWNAVSGATSYVVYRGIRTSPNQALQIGTSTVNSFSDTTGAFGTRYYYWVRAVNGCGTSGFSNRDRGRRISCP
jgi:fibronectin type 3 domain-containing protein